MAPRETPTPIPAAAPVESPPDGEEPGLEVPVVEPPEDVAVAAPASVPVAVAVADDDPDADDVAVLTGVVCGLSAPCSLHTTFFRSPTHARRVDGGVRSIIDGL